MNRSDEVHKRIIETSDAFVRVVWPSVRQILGGGDLVPVEEVTDRSFAKDYLDKYAGIDCWQVLHDKNQMRGIARRLQRPVKGKPFPTFTIRHGNNGRYRCEFEKRLEAMTSGTGLL